MAKTIWYVKDPSNGPIAANEPAAYQMAENEARTTGRPITIWKNAVSWDTVFPPDATTSS